MNDIIFALRLYAREPLQSAVALLVIVAAVSLSVAFFGLYKALAFTPPDGIDRPAQIVHLGLDEGDEFTTMTPRLAAALEKEVATIEAIAALRYDALDNALVNDSQRELQAGVIGPAYFDIVRPRLAAGRVLDSVDSESEGDPVAVISHSLAQQLGATPDAAIDRRIEIDSQAFRVVGVTQAGFQGTHRDRAIDIWLPAAVHLSRIVDLPPETATQLSSHIVLRIAGNVSPRQVERELTAVIDELPPASRRDLRGSQPAVSTAFAADPERQQRIKTALVLLGASTVLISVIAGANIGLFFLARAPARRPELAIRRAVGATSGRLARQLVIESALLVVVGGLLGVFASLWLRLGLARLPVFDAVLAQQLKLVDGAGLLVAVGLIALLTVTVSLAPAVNAWRTSRIVSSETGGARPGLNQRILALVQVTLATVICAFGLHFAHSMYSLMLKGPGYVTDNVVVLEPSPLRDGGNFRPDLRELPALQADLRERLTALPSVDSVAFATQVPTESRGGSHEYQPENGVRETVQADGVMGHADWLNVLRVPVRHGRLPEADEPYSAVVNEEFARQAWGRTDVVGEWIHPPGRMGGGAEPFRVAAVVAGFHFEHPSGAIRPMVIVNRLHVMSFNDAILIRGTIEPSAASEAVRGRLADYTPPLHVARAYTLENAYRQLTAGDRLRAILSIGATLTVVGLALLGYLGTMRYLVAAGRREFGLRAALGASPLQLRRQVMARGLMLALPGLVAGGLLGLVCLHLLAGPLDNTTGVDWYSPLLAVTLLAGLLWAAAWGPGRDVERQSPADVLRND